MIKRGSIALRLKLRVQSSSEATFPFLESLLFPMMRADCFQAAAVLTARYGNSIHTEDLSAVFFFCESGTTGDFFLLLKINLVACSNIATLYKDCRSDSWTCFSGQCLFASQDCVSATTRSRSASSAAPHLQIFNTPALQPVVRPALNIFREIIY